ncbi:MAG: bifunctional 3'-5' exonuclease/DNA polymerase [Stackebrandtia sp.]
MHIAAAPGHDGQAWLRRLAADGEPLAPPEHVDDFAAAVRALEAAESPRWVLAETASSYPGLLRAGVRIARCHDACLVEAILLSAEGRGGQPRSVAAAYARLHDLPVPAPGSHAATANAGRRSDFFRQDTLFDDSDKPDPRADLEALVEVHAAQKRRLAELPDGLRLLVAAESAGGLVAAEMTHHGLPWRVDVHDAILTDLIGPRPVAGLRPKKLQAVADEISRAFDAPLNPDSPLQVLAAFKAAGFPIESTRAWELKKIDHPAVTPLLKYKELARIWTAHGWNWARDWISDGPAGPDSPAKRFRPEYVVGGVVTGRWATDGGGALQIPKVIRGAAVADSGWRLVVADAAQLEPRMLAAMSADDGMTAAAQSHDMYAALAPTFHGSRDDAKIALLSAMYGGTAGNATALLALMRQRFPDAHALVEQAARKGERGETVRTCLGRASPPASQSWWNALTGARGDRAARDRGRFTRNFVVQGTAAEWALVMMALLRTRLHEEGLGNLVFFQHDEIIVHCPAEHAETVSRRIEEASDTATREVFGDTPVRVPLTAEAVDSYADAK